MTALAATAAAAPAVATSAVTTSAVATGSNANAVYLADAQRLLALFAQGLHGSYLHLKPTDALTGQFRPEGASTDGTAVYLPSLVDTFATPRHNLGLYKVAVLHQLGFYECGTFSFRIEVARGRIPQLPEPSELLSSRALDLEQFFALWEAPVLMRRLFMTLEDLRIDVAMRRRYPGAVHDLERALDQALSTRPDIFAMNPFAGLLEGLVQYTLGADADLLVDADATGLLRAMLQAAASLQRADADVYDSARAAMQCFNVLVEAGLPRLGDAAFAASNTAGSPAADNAVASGRPAPLDETAMEAAPVDFRGEVQPEAVQRQMRLDKIIDALDGLAASTDDELPTEALDRLVDEHGLKEPTGLNPIPAPPGSAPTEARRGKDGAGMPGLSDVALDAQSLLRDAKARRDELTRYAELDRATLRRMFGDATAASRSFLYDEWDFHQQTYLKGWCRLFEHRLRGDDLDFIGNVRSRHAALAQQVERQFRAVKPQTYLRVRRVREGEELDLDGIVEAVVDRRARRTPDEHLYMRRDRALREVSAAFLLDMSASTDDPVVDPNAPPLLPSASQSAKEEDDDAFIHSMWNVHGKRPPEPPRRRVIDVGKESLALMCDALEALGDRYGIYGFSGYGREEVEFYVAKEFEERLTAKVWSAMAAMKPRRSTRMGPAIRHALKKLKRQDVRMKVLIIVSDGFPQDHDYGPDRTDHEYGIQDTAKALREAAQQGVQTFCVTIDQSGHDYLRRMCADNRYLVISDVESLPAELTKLYRVLTS